MTQDTNVMFVQSQLPGSVLKDILYVLSVFDSLRQYLAVFIYGSKMFEIWHFCLESAPIAPPPVVQRLFSGPKSSQLLLLVSHTDSDVKVMVSARWFSFKK